MQEIDKFIDRCNIETRNHQSRVSGLCIEIARQLDLRPEAIEVVRLASIIHDIGKVSIAESILNRPGPLTPDERILVMEHSRNGFNMVADSELHIAVKNAILHHHERIDGSGYPERLSGGQLTPEEKILAVADVVDAMSSHRPYNSNSTIDDAMAEIEKNSGILYDPKVVEACMKIIKSR